MNFTHALALRLQQWFSPHFFGEMKMDCTNSARHFSAFNRFFASALMFVALLAGTPAQAQSYLPDTAKIEITKVEGSNTCKETQISYKITNLTPNEQHLFEWKASVYQQGVANGVIGSDNIHSF